jgi:DNA-binding transcriptional regulator YiaG
MGYIATMDKLTRTLEEMDLTDSYFASKVGVSVYAVRKWRSGERTPRDKHKTKIEAITQGRIKIIDWYPKGGSE